MEDTGTAGMLSFVVPLLDEQDSLQPLYEAITQAVAGVPACYRSYEIIFIDDGSVDGSPAVLRKLHDGDPCHVRVIQFRRNFGKTAAMTAGFAHARGEVVVTMDADLQDDPAELPKLLAKLDEGYRGLVFSRSNPNSVREKIPGRKAEIYWLTEHESKKVKTVPPSLEKIVMLSEEHMRLDGPSIVVLDDLHYLISNATFEGVVRFLRAMVDTVSERQAIFVVSISPESLRLQERSIIERELESVRP